MKIKSKSFYKFLKPHLIGYFLKRNSWVFHLFRDLKGVNIKDPIFLLGCQGDGLTFISRVLRRNINIISSTGNSKYWTGADEMAAIYEPYLSKNLRSSGFLTRDKVNHPIFKSPRSWTYANNDLIQHYRIEYSNLKSWEIHRFINSIKLALKRFGTSKRFIDKSQIFTINLKCINQILVKSNPYFILITRNPYVSIYRAAMLMDRDDLKKNKELKFEEKLRYCSEHWNNSMSHSLKDSLNVNNFHILRIEDFLIDPEIKTKELCKFLNLQFSGDMLPKKNQKIPYFTRYNSRWYPIKRDLNSKYKNEIKNAYLQIMRKTIEPIAVKLGYNGL